MNRKDDGTLVVRLANPKSLEYQVVRTSLLPGLLKTIRENKAHPLPIKVFETSDIVIKDPTAERQTRNIRHAAAVWCNKTAGFEVVHGLLDRMMAMLEVPRISNETKEKATVGYYLAEIDGMLGYLLATSAIRQKLDLMLFQTPLSSQAVQPRFCIDQDWKGQRRLSLERSASCTLAYWPILRSRIRVRLSSLTLSRS